MVEGTRDLLPILVPARGLGGEIAICSFVESVALGSIIIIIAIASIFSIVFLPFFETT